MSIWGQWTSKKTRPTIVISDTLGTQKLSTVNTTDSTGTYLPAETIEGMDKSVSSCAPFISTSVPSLRQRPYTCNRRYAYVGGHTHHDGRPPVLPQSSHNDAMTIKYFLNSLAYSAQCQLESQMTDHHTRFQVL